MSVEAVKQGSRSLRGSLASDLADHGSPTLSADSKHLIKFHGIYAQDDRDQRRDRARRKVELAHIFMARASIPGGVLTADQWLAMDRLADEVADGSMRLTTRQGLQFHGVVKTGLRPLVASLNATLVTTLGACGDVVRNTMSCPAPLPDRRNARLHDLAQMLASRFRPQTRAYAEIWLDGEKAATFEESADAESEPLYGSVYLPRKFKIAVAWPGDNCVDVYANDLGVVPAEHPDHGPGFVILVGGGLGMNHAHEGTYPRLASPMAWVEEAELGDVADAVLIAFRDHGDRTDRKRARLKYVIEDRGLAWFRTEVESVLGRPLLDPIELPEWDADHAHVDHLGWHDQGDGRWFLGVHVPSGRIRDHREGEGLKSAIREITTNFSPVLRITPNQDLLISDLPASAGSEVDGILAGHGVIAAASLTPTRRHVLACPALPTCGQALGEAERVLPQVLDIIDTELAERGLAHVGLQLRVTGCPNGCARPYTAELGLVGRSKNTYDIHVGGSPLGTRLGGIFQTGVKLDDLASSLGPLLDQWRDERKDDESFGDFAHRMAADSGGSRR